MELKNQPCYNKEGEFIGWLSRSVSIFCATFAYDSSGNPYVLASQRGKGTPDPELIGKWNCCTGYVEYNENLIEAAIRETFEETGIRIYYHRIMPCNYPLLIEDDPRKDKRQNIIIRYYCVLPNNISAYKFSKKYNEKDEVGEIKWIPVQDIQRYEWAFNHDTLIDEIYYSIISNCNK